MKEIVKLSGVSFGYGNQPVLSDIDLAVEEKDFMAVIGPNGGGKTTLLKVILGFLKPDRGTARVFGSDPLKVRSRIGYLPQNGGIQRDFPISVLEVVMTGVLTSRSLLPVHGKSTRTRALELLEQMQISDIASRRIGELSGGQLQRSLLARALMADPELLILDEPTSSVDLHMELDIFETLRDLNQNKTIILVSHDIAFISSYVNKVTCLNRCSCTHMTDDISSENIMETYNGSIKSLRHSCEL